MKKLITIIVFLPIIFVSLLCAELIIGETTIFRSKNDRVFVKKIQEKLVEGVNKINLKELEDRDWDIACPVYPYNSPSDVIKDKIQQAEKIDIIPSDKYMYENNWGILFINSQKRESYIYKIHHSEVYFISSVECVENDGYIKIDIKNGSSQNVKLSNL